MDFFSSKTNPSWVCVTESFLVQAMVSSLPSSQNNIIDMFFLYMQQNSPALSVPFLVFIETYTFVIITTRLKHYLPALESSLD